MHEYLFLNGKIISASEAFLPIHDLSILRGYSIFDYFPINNGVPTFWEDYSERFFKSIKALDLFLPYSKMETLQFVLQLIEKNDLKEGYVRLLLSGGYSEDGFLPENENFTFAIILYPPVFHSKEIYDKGIKLILSEYVRPHSTVKVTNYSYVISQRKRIKAENAFDLLYVKDGYISEASRSNFFIVNEHDVVVTPDEHVLMGITRKKYIEMASKMFEVEVRPLHMDEVKRAKEAFITSTTKGSFPVVQIDDVTIGNGLPGKVCRQLKEQYFKAIDNYRLNP